METATIIVNTKHYKRSSGVDAPKFLESFIPIVKTLNHRVIFALNPIDLHLASSFPELQIYSQTVFPVEYGAYTGKFSIDALVELGVKGSLLNHSENRMRADSIAAVSRIARERSFNLVICSANAKEAIRMSRLSPEFVAYEPPDLIGGDVSVSSARPEIISEVVKGCGMRNTKVLVGAGIKARSDVAMSLSLGAKGILIASGIVLSRDPPDALASLVGSR
ncbi:MAG: triose-phosphate isomerase [Thermoplasmataceae archaeon]